jgi:hypothetical protein
VARLFVERAAAANDWAFLDRLPRLVRDDEDGREILYAAVDALAAPAHRGRLHQLLRRHGDLVRKSHRGWAKATDALVAVRDYPAAATWAADWEERKPDEPWMLRPLAAAFRQLGRTDDAYRVTVYALELPGEDPTTDDFRVWLAFEAALEGRPDRATGLLADVDEEELDDVPHILHTLTRSLIRVQRGGRREYPAARAEGLEAVRQLAPRSDDPDLTLSFRRWARRLAQDAGGLGPWVWAVFQARRLPKVSE